ncbi:MAG: phage late control D family protein [Planctomycetota bacterium]
MKDFGGYRRDSFLAHAVQGFFLNGGSRCFVVRVASSSAAIAFAVLQDRAGAPEDSLRIQALNEVFVERDKFHFHTPRDATAAVEGALEYRRNLRSFDVRLSVERQVTKVVVKGWDAEKKEPIVAIATGGDTARSVLGEKAASDFVREDFGEGAKILHDLVPRSVKEAEELAKACLRKSEYALIEGSGSVVGDPGLRAKTIVEVAGIGKRYSGPYYLTRVTHSIGDGGYVSDFECHRNAVS